MYAAAAVKIHAAVCFHQGWLVGVTGNDDTAFLTAVVNEILFDMAYFGVVFGCAGWVFDAANFQRTP